MKLRLQPPSLGLCYAPVFLQQVPFFFTDVRISLYRIAGTSLVDEYTRGSTRPGTVRMSERLLLQPPPRLFHVACQINVFLLLILLRSCRLVQASKCGDAERNERSGHSLPLCSKEEIPARLLEVFETLCMLPAAIRTGVLPIG